MKAAPTAPDDTLAYTVPEAARQLRVGVNTMYRPIADGSIKAKDIRRKGSRKGMTRVPRSEIVRYLNESTAATSNVGS